MKLKKLNKTQQKILEAIKNKGYYFVLAGLITNSYHNVHGKLYKVGARDEKAVLKLAELGLISYEIDRYSTYREYIVKAK